MSPSAPWRAALRPATALAVGVALAVAAGCADAPHPPSPPGATEPAAVRPATVPATAGPRTPAPAPISAPPGPAPLVDPRLDLRSGPVDVPIALHLPSLGVEAEVMGVGLDATDAMEAPVGAIGDPVWSRAFWYRGSAVPGAPSTALIAGHVGSRGGPGVFARLGELVAGDPIVVEDRRTGVATRFVVVETAEYTLEQAGGADVMTRIYGAGPVAGRAPEPSVDGRAHLTLVTCSGTFRGGTHDHRRVVSAVATP